MAKVVLTNVRMFSVGLDMTASSSSAELSVEVEDKDVTTFASAGWREFLGGLESASVKAAGFWEAGSADLVDDATWLALGGVGPMTVAPVGAAVGDVAYLGQMLTAKYQLLAEVGEVAPFEIEAQSSGVMPRGVVAHPPGTARTASGTGTSLNLGAVPAGKALYAAVHILSVTSTLNLTVRVETDNATGFPSATTVATATAATAANSPQGQWLSAVGPITDDWQRVAWTTSGTGSALFIVSLGIG